MPEPHPCPMPLPPDTTVMRFAAGPPGSAHLIGICGVGMAGLAVLLSAGGWQVTGCDLRRGRLASWLAARGIKVQTGHSPRHVTHGCDAVIRSAAVADSCAEIVKARSLGIPVFRRGEVLAALVSACRSIAVAGTHGKTTTAALLAHIMRHAGMAPSFAIGGDAPQLGGVAFADTGGWLIVEADESDGTLAGYSPEIAVVTNVEFDHAEHYRGVRDLQESFKRFSSASRRAMVFCADNPRAAAVAACAGRRSGAGVSAAAEWRARRIRHLAGGVCFDVEHKGRALGRVQTRLRGLHNVRNMLTAVAAAALAKTPWRAISEALASFEGVGRRFELLAKRDNMAVYTDYAHHPTEVRALAAAARRLPAARLAAVFQPHRYTRTRAMGKAFASAFDAFDPLLLLPVYAASEEPVQGGTIGYFYERLRACRAAPPQLAFSTEQAVAFFQRILRQGDVLFGIGAGDGADTVAREIAGTLGQGCAVRAYTPALSSIELSRAALLRLNEPLAAKTTFGLGGPADIWAACAQERDVRALRRWAAENNLPFTVLGAGSNVLVSDLGVRGVVARLKGPSFIWLARKDSGAIEVGAGTPLKRLANWSASQGLTGLEFLAGIPGTLGGALKMNAGAHGSELGDHVLWVRYMENDGSVKIARARELAFCYRSCPGLEGRVALSAGLAASPESPARARGRIRACLEKRAWMTGLRSAGSMFRNPLGSEPAGRLLERLGLKGRAVGGARVSLLHANILEAGAGATASDVAALADQIRVEAKARAGVTLKEEVVYLG